MKINTEQLINVIDFWQKSAEEDALVERDALGEIDLKTKEVIDIVGPRRGGKSSLLKLIINQPDIKANSLYINFEDPFFIEHNSPQTIEEIILVYKEYFNKNLKFTFFDEVQAIGQWERAVRKLRDAGGIKIFVTGSSSKLLRRELSTLLTGRHLSYKILPLSFSEFLRFRKVSVEGKKELILLKRKIKGFFGEYIRLGGFPEAVLTKKTALLKQYFFDIIEKDVVMRYEIRDRRVLEKIAVFLLSNAGKIISIESIKKTFDISFAAAVSYVSYLKEAFLIFDLEQFAYSLKTQQKALKKIYSIDCGLSGAVSFRFFEDKGRILENIVFIELLRRYSEIYYYKTKNNLEVDFITKEKLKVKEIIQVCWDLEDDKTKAREINGLSAAMDELGLEQGLLLSYDEEGMVKVGKKIINIIPVYHWLLEKN